MGGSGQSFWGHETAQNEYLFIQVPRHEQVNE